MKFFNLIAGAILAVIATAYNACEDGDRPFAPMQAVGDKHDASKYDVDICETQWNSGSVVQAIEVWGSKSRISGIQLTYSNGQKSHMIGARAGDLHQNLKWDSKTLVTRVVLWSDWDARQLGGLRVELSNGDKLEMKQDRISTTTFSPNVGSGILLGAYGRADDHITAWGWLFLESSVDKISIGDFKWDQTQEQFMKSQSSV